jgi:hypothetical protein
LRLQNLETRATTSTDLASQLRSAAQNNLKSLNSRASSTFGSTLSELEAAQVARESAAGSVLGRQNLVVTASNSRALLATTSSPVPADPSNPVAPLTSTGAPAPTTVSGLQSWIDAADRTAANVHPAETSTSNPAAPGGPNDTTPPSPAAPPTLYSMTQSVSSDPSVFTTENYSQQLLYSSYLSQANNENSLRYQNYTTEYQNWQLNGSQGNPPAGPVYETIDPQGFNEWYAQMTQNYSLGVDAPPVSMFMANGPDYGNGYYGAVGTSQVATLYNPTGPATPAQISAAGGSNS